MRPVQVRGVTLGDARTAIIVPLTAADPAVLAVQARRAATSGVVDLVEWRADAVLAACAPDAPSTGGGAPTGRAGAAARAGAQRRAALAACGEAIREAVGNMPVLATVRTAREGGPVEVTPEELLHVHADLLEGPAADLLDIEALAEPAQARLSMILAHEAGRPVVASHHRFDATPPVADMVEILQRLEGAGAAVVKLAVMPRSGEDVLALMEASLRASAELTVPRMTISMGPLGALTRLSGALLGQAATFAALEETSAPGQLDAHTVARALRALGARD